MIRIPDKHLNDYLLGSLGYSGAEHWRPRPDEDTAPLAVGRREPATLFTAGMQAHQEAVGAGHLGLPLFLALDLRLLAEFGYEFTYTHRDIAGFDSMLRARYENQILNRLLREHRVQQAIELLSFHRARQDDLTLPNPAFTIRAARLTRILIERLAPHWPAPFAINAAHLRNRTLGHAQEGALAEAAQRWRAFCLTHGDDAVDLDASLERFIQSATGARQGVTPVSWHRALEPQDLFELEHQEALDREYLRLGVRHIIEVMDSLPALDPHEIELREEQSEIESGFMDDSYYPTGGFSEITNRGSFENLVLSELIYMGEGVDVADTPAQREASAGQKPLREGVDLFDLRFVEGELLFYTRDSGQLYRKRRMLRLVIDMHQTLNLKYPEHPYQLGTMVAGTVLALVRDLTLLFSNDALRFAVHILADAGNDAAHRLSETLSILLESPIQHGALEILLEESFEPSALGSHHRKTYAIIFSANTNLIDSLDGTLADLRTASPPLFPTLVDLSPEASERDEAPHMLKLASDERGLTDLKQEILLDIMHSRRPGHLTSPQATFDDDDGDASL